MSHLDNTKSLRTELLRAIKKGDSSAVATLLDGQDENLAKGVAQAMKNNDRKRAKSLLS